MFKIKLLIESDLIRNSELKNHSFFYVLLQKMFQVGKRL